MDELVYVYVALGGASKFCGRLWARARKGQESASFEYDEGWLRAANRFSLEPALSLGPGSFHTGQGKALFGAIGDSAPDKAFMELALIVRDPGAHFFDGGIFTGERSRGLA